MTRSIPQKSNNRHRLFSNQGGARCELTPVRLDSDRYRSVTIDGITWSERHPVRRVPGELAERLQGMPYFCMELKPKANRQKGEALIFLRAGQASTFWEVAKGLARCGVRTDFCELHRNRRTDVANQRFLSEKGLALTSIAESEPRSLPRKVSVPGYDVEELTRFARWRWAQRGVTADAYITARTSWLIPQLEKLIQEKEPLLICTWGNMCHDSRAALEVAKRVRVPALLVEGGFFPNTLSVDTRDMYFTPRSEFEEIWRRKGPLSADEESQLDEFLTRWKAGGLSKYNRPTRYQRRYRRVALKEIAKQRKVLLVACQTTGDATMYYPKVLVGKSEQLVRLACEAMGGMEDWALFVKPHPYEGATADMRECLAGTSNAYLLENATAQSAIRGADAVLTINSTLGLEALCYGKRVVTLGDNIYTNRGLTTDIRADAQPETVRRAVLHACEPESEPLRRFLHAVIFDYLYHYPPYGGQTGRMEGVVSAAVDAAGVNLHRSSPMPAIAAAGL